MTFHLRSTPTSFPPPTAGSPLKAQSSFVALAVLTAGTALGPVTAAPALLAPAGTTPEVAVPDAAHSGAATPGEQSAAARRRARRAAEVATAAAAAATNLVDDAELAAQLERLAGEHRTAVRLIRPIAGDPDFVIARLGRGDDVERRPALLLVAGLDGRMVGASRVTLDVAERLLDADDDMLDRTTVYVVPAVIADPTAGGTTAAPDDADHDGRSDEDPPQDVDGDGRILTMRLASPSPLSGFTATHVVDVDDPRILRRARDGETATHAVMREGRDADGDGRFAEDGVGGVDFGRHFPARWPEFSDGAGRWPLDHPRTRALADWVLATPALVAAVAYDHGDSATAVPVSRGNDVTGRIPLGVLEADESGHGALVDAFVAATGVAGGERSERIAGSFDAWAYGHLGLWSLATPLWDRPDRTGPITAPPAEDDAESMEDDASVDAAPVDDAGQTRRGAGRAGSDDAADSAEAAWLAWLDRRAAAGDADDERPGFVDWRTFEHPQLGTVEIGGFDPTLPVDLPADLVPAVAERQAEFLSVLVEHFPRLEIMATDHRVLGGGLYEVAVVLTNSGELPTRTAMGVRARRLTPILVRILDGDEPAAMVSGRALVRLERLEPGERQTITWTVRADDLADLRVQVDSPVFGRQTAAVDDD